MHLGPSSRLCEPSEGLAGSWGAEPLELLKYHRVLSTSEVLYFSWDLQDLSSYCEEALQRR